MADQRLNAVVEPVLAAHGLELDRIEVIPAGRRSVLRITVDGDGPRGRGPLLDDIATATHAISEALDADDSIPGSYTLEVSSRGTSSPLTEAKHFRRNTGRLLKVTLADGTTLTGRIVSSDETTLHLEVTPESVKGNRNPSPVVHDIPLSEVRKALVQVELNRPLDADLDELGDMGADDDEDDLDDEELDADASVADQEEN